MRKFFAMLMVSSMMLGLVGCGEEAKKPADTKAPATPAIEKKTETKTETKTEEKKVETK